MSWREDVVEGGCRGGEELFVQVVETMRRVLGVEHPSTLTSVANLASNSTLSQTQEKDGEKGTEYGWVDIIYHDLSLLEAQNVGGGLDPEKSLAGGLNIVPYQGLKAGKERCLEI